ncbi:Uncharacterised protein [Klebsiella pneumoniae]|nr:Uncharacterised protein [Klebsiella pneumoniae]
MHKQIDAQIAFKMDFVEGFILLNDRFDFINNHHRIEEVKAAGDAFDGKQLDHFINHGLQAAFHQQAVEVVAF